MKQKAKKKCEKCGFSGPKMALDIHHVLSVSGKRTGKTIVLCANCHRIEHWNMRKICPICKKKKFKLSKRVKGLPKICNACNRLVEETVFWTFEFEISQMDIGNIDLTFFDIDESVKLVDGLRELVLSGMIS